MIHFQYVKVRSQLVRCWFKDNVKHLNKTNFSSLFFKNLAMTGVTEGCDLIGLFNIMLGEGGVKGCNCLSIAFFPLFTSGRGIYSLHV